MPPNRSGGLGHEGKYTPNAPPAGMPTSASRLALSSMTSLYNNDSTQNFMANNNSHGNYVDIDQLDQMRFNGSGASGELTSGGSNAAVGAPQQSYFPSFMRNYSINQKHPPASLDISPGLVASTDKKLSPNGNPNPLLGSAMTLMYGSGAVGGLTGDESPIYENQLTIHNLHHRAESPIYSNTSSTSSVAIQSLSNLHQRSLYDYQTEQNIRNVLSLQQQQQQQQNNYPVPPVFPQLRYAGGGGGTATSPTNPNGPSSSSSQSLYSNLPPTSPNYYNNVMPNATSLMNVPLYSNVGQPQAGSGMTFGEHFVHNKRHNNFLEGIAAVAGTTPTGDSSPQDDTELPLPPGWSIGKGN